MSESSSDGLEQLVIDVGTIDSAERGMRFVRLRIAYLGCGQGARVRVRSQRSSTPSSAPREEDG